ncbi:polymorphic toxin-type HINT domain-containing protein [Streptomyces virginiae]|uniref:polymorphic toxin-type HINT domain-containing protein n=1 Tax=Streptomyces virginiae TaxID=1961 RepID=UPI00332D7D5A
MRDKELNKAYDAVNAAENKASAALSAFTKAKKADDEAAAAAAQARKAADEKAATEKATDSAGTESKANRTETDGETGGGGSDARSGGSADGPGCVKRNSFPTGSRVQMADGTSRAIEEVEVGDKVLATDPQTGETAPKTVTATIVTPDDKEFTDLTLTDDANPRGPPATLTSTAHHPHWNETRHQWLDAGDFAPGEQLRRPDGTTLTVQTIRNYPYAVTTHNLTVDDFHTYYVLAGATPVLVHNCGGEATVHLANYPDGRQHALITVRDGDEVLSTHQYGSLGNPDNGVTEFTPAELPAITINLKIPLSNPQAAMAYAESAMAKTRRGVYPAYDMPNQACVTYCAQVLEAGGVAGIPKNNHEAQAWLIQRYG